MARSSRMQKLSRRTREAERRDPPWLRAERCADTLDIEEYIAGPASWNEPMPWEEAERHGFY